MDHAFIGKVAGIVTAVAFVPYMISTLKGKTKPQRATFAIWAAVGIVSLASYIASGATDTIWVVWAYAILGIVVFILSLKYGVGGFEKLDVICLSGAAIGIILWITTSDPHYALYLSVLCELLGYIPTIKKTYYQPETEDKLAWIIAWFGGFLNLFAINALAFDIIIYPAYVILIDTVVVLLILVPRKSAKSV